MESEDQEREEENETDSFLNGDPFFIRFRQHLMSRNGKSRSQAEALQVSKEISNTCTLQIPQV